MADFVTLLIIVALIVGLIWHTLTEGFDIGICLIVLAGVAFLVALMRIGSD